MPDHDSDLGHCRSNDPKLGTYAAQVAEFWEIALNRLKAILDANAARELAANGYSLREKPTTDDRNN